LSAHVEVTDARNGKSRFALGVSDLRYLFGCLEPRACPLALVGSLRQTNDYLA
jgi:hypothetical protein